MISYNYRELEEVNTEKRSWSWLYEILHNFIIKLVIIRCICFLGKTIFMHTKCAQYSVCACLDINMFDVCIVVLLVETVYVLYFGCYFMMVICMKYFLYAEN